MKSGNFFEFFGFDATSVTFQNYIKESVVVLVERYMAWIWIVGIESVDHVHNLVKRYYIVVLLCRLQKS